MTDIFAPELDVKAALKAAVKAALPALLLYILFLGSFVVAYWYKQTHITIILDWILNAKVFDGELWRLITNMWLHKNLEHLHDNLFGLVIDGLCAAVFFRPGKLYATFLISGIVAGLGVMMLHPASLLMGASGGDMGLMGLAIMGAFRTFYRPLQQTLLPIWFLRLLPIFWLVGTAGQFYLDVFTPHVSGIAHLVGFATGIICGMFFTRRHLQIFA